jgi:hypothetical protein
MMAVCTYSDPNRRLAPEQRAHSQSWQNFPFKRGEWMHDKVQGCEKYRSYFCLAGHV